MKVTANPSALKQTRWYEYAFRIILGGLITVATGLIAKRFGPGVGGLFLAFPAIFPAGITLLEKHTREKRRRAGLDGTLRARNAASLDARGSALGSLGLIAFALVVWQFLSARPPWLVMCSAAIAWLAVAFAAWRFRRTLKSWQAARAREKRRTTP